MTAPGWTHPVRARPKALAPRARAQGTENTLTAASGGWLDGRRIDGVRPRSTRWWSRNQKRLADREVG